MLIKIDRIQRIILRDLFAAKGKLDPYTIYRRYYILPHQLIKAIQPFAAKGYLTSNKGALELTNEGMAWLTDNKVFINSSKDKPWLIIPESFKQPCLSVGEFYVPRISIIDKKIIPSKYRRLME